jgi:hypothetical protein
VDTVVQRRGSTVIRGELAGVVETGASMLRRTSNITRPEPQPRPPRMPSATESRNILMHQRNTSMNLNKAFCSSWSCTPLQTKIYIRTSLVDFKRRALRGRFSRRQNVSTWLSPSKHLQVCKPFECSRPETRKVRSSATRARASGLHLNVL